MDIIKSSEFKQVQLRLWLKKLGLKTSGNKDEMIARLNALTPEARGTAPQLDEKDSEYETDDGEIAVESQQQATVSVVNDELEVLRRERQLLMSENELLKLKLSAEKEQPTVRNIDLAAEQHIPITLVKELLPDFDENSNFDLWKSQIVSVSEIYSLNDNIMRALIISKIKGKVLNWLHGHVNCAAYSVDQLLKLMEEAFGVKQNKLLIRQRFEERKWKIGETFADYLNDKNLLSTSLQLDEGELVDYIVDGIPDELIRFQALMQCFKNKSQLLQAFSKIQLKRSSGLNAKQWRANDVDKGQTRCFNCNSLGHWAAECRKEKREYGTCFGCGEKDHKVIDCPKRKSTVSSLKGDNFVRLVKFSLNYNDKQFYFNLETLVDTGSPISFLKKQCLPTCVELNILCLDLINMNFFGLNKSKLEIVGKISCSVIIDNFVIPLNMMVVADNSISVDAILGRDFLLKTNSKLVFDFNDCDKLMQGKFFESTNLEPVKDQYCKQMSEQILDKCTTASRNNVSLAKSFDSNDCLDNLIIVSDYDTNFSKNDRTNFRKNNLRMSKQVNVNNHINISNLESFSKDKIEEVCTNSDKRYEEILDYDADNLEKFELSLMAVDLMSEEKDCLNTGDAVDYKTKVRLTRLYDENYLLPERPSSPDLKCEMRIVLNSEKPFNCCPRRISYSERNELQKLIDKYSEKGYIRPSNSEYASAIVLVRKKNGELRMCVDFRNLNKITAKDYYPIPLIDDLLDKLARKDFLLSWISKMGSYTYLCIHSLLSSLRS